MPLHTVTGFESPSPSDDLVADTERKFSYARVYETYLEEVAKLDRGEDGHILKVVDAFTACAKRHFHKELSDAHLVENLTDPRIVFPVWADMVSVTLPATHPNAARKFGALSHLVDSLVGSIRLSTKMAEAPSQVLLIGALSTSIAEVSVESGLKFTLKQKWCVHGI